MHRMLSGGTSMHLKFCYVMCQVMLEVRALGTVKCIRCEPDIKLGKRYKWNVVTDHYIISFS